MQDFQALLSQAAGGDLTQSKQADLAVTAANKKTAMNAAAGRGNDIGLISAPERELDMRTLDPFQMTQKYGAGAADMIRANADASQTRLDNALTQRTSGYEAAGDVGTDVALGVANSLGGIGALGAGAVNADAGVWTAQKLEEMNNWAQGTQSRTMQARRANAAVTADLRSRDNDAKREQDLAAGDSEAVAGLKRMGRGALSSIANEASDGVLLGSGVAQGVGSVLTSGPTGKAITAAASVAGKGAAALAKRVAVPAAIGLQEGAGAYQQTAADIAKMPFEKLAAGSALYNQLVGQGSTPEEARTAVANRAGMFAAAVQAPIAAATGTLVAKFEGNPLAGGSMRGMLGNMGREFIEEGLQSGSGQAAQNLAKRETADSTQSLTDQVGEQAGQGALYGLGAAGVVQAPHIATAVGGAVVAPIIKGVGFAGEKLMGRYDALTAKTEAASPVSTDKVKQAAAEAVAAAPEAVQSVAEAVDAMPDVTPEDKAAATTYMSDLTAAASFDPTPYMEMPGLPAHIKEAMTSATDKLSLIDNLTKQAMNAKTPAEGIQSAQVLNAMLDEMSEIVLREPKALENLPDDHPAVEFLSRYKGVLSQMTQTKDVMKARAAVNVATRNIKSMLDANPVTAENIDTPKGQAAVRFHIAAAEMAPEHANLEAVQAILANDKVQITEPQRKALMVASALLQGARTMDAARVAAGMKPLDYVSREIQTNEAGPDKGKQSAVQHAKGVRTAYLAGQTDLARTRLEDFMKFAQHMQNKVGAFNANLAGRDVDANGATHYQALSADASRAWKESEKGFVVHPTRSGSVELGQTIAMEAQTLAGIANALADAFPELNVGHIGVTQLDPLLAGASPKVVADEFAKGTRKVPGVKEAPVKTAAATVDATTEATAKPDLKPSPEPVVAAEASANKEPVKADTKVVEKPTPEVKLQAVDSMSDEDLVNQRKGMEAISKPTEQVTTRIAEIDAEQVKRAPVVEEAVAEPTKKEGIAAALAQSSDRDLAISEGNTLLESFSVKPDGKQTSALLGMSEPIKTIEGAIRSSVKMREFTGVAGTKRITPAVRDAYTSVIFSELPALIKDMEKALAKVLGKGKNLARLEAGDASVARMQNTKTLALVERDGEGFAYNRELVEGAALAGMQWLITGSELVGVIDNEAAAGMADIESWQVTPELVNAMKVGVGRQDALDALANKIAEYWGLQTVKNAETGYTEGLPLAMATEVLQALVATGSVKETFVKTDKNGNVLKDGEPGVHRTNSRLSTTEKMADNHPIRAFPNLIDKMMLVSPEPTRFFGDERPPVAETQMRNPMVQNSREAKIAIEANQDTAYYRNDHMATFILQGLGLEGVLSLLGHGVDPDPDNFNAEHFKTIEGQTQTLISAFQSLEGTMMELDSRALDAGVDANDLGMHYAFNMSKVSRLQMLGKYTPQSDKLVREAIMPTRATMDLSDKSSFSYQSMQLAQAQALGIKVHQISRATMVQKLNEALAGEFAPALEVLEQFRGSQAQLNQAQIDTLKSSLGTKMSAVALHALAEEVRIRASTPEELKNFQTHMYVEADGVTNGPINAINLLTSGWFDANQIENMAKGGFMIGETGTTMNFHREYVDSTDMYKKTSNKTSDKLADVLAHMDKDTIEYKSMSSMLNLMNQFFGGDVQFDETNGTLVVDRGIAKNPLTITLYGAGALGIAGNIAEELVKKIYAKMSDAIQRGGDDVATAMFPGVNGKEQFAAMFDSLNQMIEFEADAEGGVGPSGVEFNNKPDLQTFKLRDEQFQVLQKNILAMFVTPLRESISEVVGKNLVANMDMLRQATQLQSIVLARAFNDAVQAKLVEKKAQDGWKPTDGLTRPELDAIYQEALKTSPIISTGTQEFLVAKTERNKLLDSIISEGMRGGWETPTNVQSPADAGVGGVASIVIGSGDGNMMQLVSAMAQAVERSLLVFDGMNIPLDNIERGSRLANQAAYEAWMGNPLKGVSESFGKMLTNLEGRLDATDMKLMAKSLFGPMVDMKKLTVADVKDALTGLNYNLRAAASSIDMRHQVLRELTASVDQMASVGAPHQIDGITISGTNEEKADAINKIIADRIGKAAPVKQATTAAVVSKPAAPVAKAAGVDISAQLNKFSKATFGGARETSFTNLGKMARDLTKQMTKSEAALTGEMLRSLGLKGWRVVSGDLTQVSTWLDLNKIPFIGLSPQQIEAGLEIKGFANSDHKVIVVVDPKLETLFHEMVHATTGDMVNQYYGDGLTGEKAPIVRAAINNIEKLYQQFVSMNPDTIPAELKTSYDAFKAATADYVSKGNMPAAIAEFMAWGLANRDLAKLQEQTQTHPLIKMAESLYKAIKEMIWGKKVAPSIPGSDMFSNLVFNSGVVMRSVGNNNPPLSARAQNVELFHAAAYGSSDRLNDLYSTFNKAVTSYISSARTPLQMSARMTAEQAGQIVGTQMALAFDKANLFKTDQERDTFNVIQAAMATEAALDPNAMLKAQEVYAHVTKTLTVEHFMDDAAADLDADRYYAQLKYNTVMGNIIELKDASGRSTLLPSFLALSMVSDDFRKILSTIDLPKKQALEWGSIDGALESVGTFAMQSLGQRFSGEGTSGNAGDTLAALSQRLQDVVNQQETKIEEHFSKAGGFVDYVNEKALENLEALSTKVMDTADTVTANTNSKVIKGLAQFTKAVASLATEENASHVAEGMLTGLNRTKLWRPVYDVIKDMIGRTTSEADVYDKIKKVRAFVQQVRQGYVESVPSVIAKQFSRQLTEAEWTVLHNGLAKTDLAALQATGVTGKALVDMLADDKKLAARIASLEADLNSQGGLDAKRLQEKTMQLANFMTTGVAGVNLLRNAHAVAHLFGEKVSAGRKLPSTALIRTVDHLASLYAVSQQSDEAKKTLASLAQAEEQGLTFALSYLVGQRVEEQRKAASNSVAQINNYKGFIPSNQAQGMSLIVADDADFVPLREQSYQRVADYKGSSLDTNKNSRGYYYSPVGARAMFNQGIMQNVRQTVNGIDAQTGLTMGAQAGRITDKQEIARITRQLGKETGRENLLPVYNSMGLVTAFERSIDPTETARLNYDTHMAKNIGIWRGRQAEEEAGQVYNTYLIESLHEMYEKDSRTVSGLDGYVDLFDEKGLSTDPVLQDAVRLMSPSTREMIKAKFGDRFMVRKSLLDDATGYRQASVGDAWTGNTRWSGQTQERAKRLAISVFGDKAYQYAVTAEKTLQNFVSDARVLIVVKSMVVPMVNLVSNFYQLVGRGVPVANIIRGMPKKTVEVDTYVKTKLRAIEAEAELRAADGNVIQERKLKAEIQSINDSHKRMSIWPLIEAGEFSSISDAGISRDEILLSEGRLHAYMEQLVSRLPGSLKTAGRYALVTKDTALFEGLQRSVEYGDFLAKAILYDDLVGRGKLSKEQALGRVTEEFVNYDRLPGRFRGYMESVGMLWFYNFKIRSTKVALSMMRNNPVHALLAGLAPAPAGVGTPMGDNLFSKGLAGSLTNSIGIGQGLRAPTLNPWANLVF